MLHQYITAYQENHILYTLWGGKQPGKLEKYINKTTSSILHKGVGNLVDTTNSRKTSPLYIITNIETSETGIIKFKTPLLYIIDRNYPFYITIKQW